MAGGATIGKGSIESMLRSESEEGTRGAEGGTRREVVASSDDGAVRADGAAKLGEAPSSSSLRAEASIVDGVAGSNVESERGASLGALYNTASRAFSSSAIGWSGGGTGDPTGRANGEKDGSIRPGGDGSWLERNPTTAFALPKL